MSHPAKAVASDLSSLGDDLRALLAATSDIAEDQVVEARKRLSSALNQGKSVYSRSAKNADKFVRGHSYETAAIAFGLGALAALLLARQCER
jgi:ElaB/YqjD/DUF883 family membrane-anchored ribosome-binding protein